MFSRTVNNKVLVIFVWLVLMASSVLAEDNKNTETKITKPSTETQTTASESAAIKEKPNKTKTKVTTLGTFRPTEDISEDLSVSFPVDI